MLGWPAEKQLEPRCPVPWGPRLRCHGHQPKPPPQRLRGRRSRHARGSARLVAARTSLKAFSAVIQAVHVGSKRGCPGVVDDCGIELSAPRGPSASPRRERGSQRSSPRPRAAKGRTTRSGSSRDPLPVRLRHRPLAMHGARRIGLVLADCDSSDGHRCLLARGSLRSCDEHFPQHAGECSVIIATTTPTSHRSTCRQHPWRERRKDRSRSSGDRGCCPCRTRNLDRTSATCPS